MRAALIRDSGVLAATSGSALLRCGRQCLFCEEELERCGCYGWSWTGGGPSEDGWPGGEGGGNLVKNIEHNLVIRS